MIAASVEILDMPQTSAVAVCVVALPTLSILPEGVLRVQDKKAEESVKDVLRNKSFEVEETLFVSIGSSRTSEKDENNMIISHARAKAT